MGTCGSAALRWLACLLPPRLCACIMCNPFGLRDSSLRNAQGSWLQDLRSLESVNLLSTAGHLAFDLSGLPGTVRDVRLTATELQGSVRADHRLQTLQLKSGRALDITVIPPRDGAGAHDGGGASEVLSRCAMPSTDSHSSPRTETMLTR